MRERERERETRQSPVPVNGRGRENDVEEDMTTATFKIPKAPLTTARAIKHNKQNKDNTLTKQKTVE
jgi:hypothetical protein